MVAVALVGIAAALLGATARAMNRAVWWIEVASYALIAAMGAQLLWVKGRGSCASGRAARAEERRRGRDRGACATTVIIITIMAHGHDHHRSRAMITTIMRTITTTIPAIRTGRRRISWPARAAGSAASMAIFAVGLRPCSGAILVLVFALAQGIFWAGVAATFVMGLGTAITVAAIATLTVTATAFAARVAASRTGYGSLALRAIEVGAAALVLVFGVALLAGYMANERMIGCERYRPLLHRRRGRHDVAPAGARRRGCRVLEKHADSARPQAKRIPFLPPLCRVLSATGTLAARTTECTAITICYCVEQDFLNPATTPIPEFPQADRRTEGCRQGDRAACAPRDRPWAAASSLRWQPFVAARAKEKVEERLGAGRRPAAHNAGDFGHGLPAGSRTVADDYWQWARVLEAHRARRRGLRFRRLRRPRRTSRPRAGLAGVRLTSRKIDRAVSTGATRRRSDAQAVEQAAR